MMRVNPPQQTDSLRSVLVVAAAMTVMAGEPGLARDKFASPRPEDVSALIACLDDPDTQTGASRALVRLGEPAVDGLRAALSSDNETRQIWSAWTLGRIGPPAASAVPSLTAMLNAHSSELRATAAQALGRLNPVPPSTAEALGRLLSDSAPRARLCAAEALARSGQSAMNAAPLLIDALADPPIRPAALEALVGIGPAATPILTRALSRDAVRLEAAEALRRVNPTGAEQAGVVTPSIADLAALHMSVTNTQERPDVRIRRAAVLGQLGTDGAATLISVFDDQDVSVARAAAAAFAQIGAPAIALLREPLRNESPVIRAATVDALSAIGPAAPAVVRELVVAIEDEDRTVRHRAVIALNRLGPAAGPAVPQLIAVMNNPREREPTRQWAIKALARTGPDQREAVIKALQTATSDDNYGVRSLAETMRKRLEAP